jgi:hypothetical protein
VKTIATIRYFNCGNKTTTGNPSILRQKMNYLHENPVRAGFVEKAEDWIYSSAAHYYVGKKSLIELSYV